MIPYNRSRIFSCLLSFAYAGFGGWNYAIACPNNVQFEHEGQQICAYDVTLSLASTEKKSSILRIAPEIIANLFGRMVSRAFYIEATPFGVSMTPSNEHKSYLRCAYRARLWSEAGSNSYRNTELTAQSGIWEWALPYPGVGRGDNWLRADFVWVSHHPSFLPDPVTCERIADGVIKAIDAERERQRQAAETDVAERETQKAIRDSQRPASFQHDK